MRLKLLLMCFTFATAMVWTPAHAQEKSEPLKRPDVIAFLAGPTQVMRKFCKLDLEGARFSGEGRREISELIASPKEPGWLEGWTSIVVVSKCEVPYSKTEGGKGVVRAKFPVLGRMEGNHLILHKTEETIELEIVRKKDEWRIQGPAIVPHVSASFLRTHVQELLESGSRSPEEKANLENAIAKLKELEKEEP